MKRTRSSANLEVKDDDVYKDLNISKKQIKVSEVIKKKNDSNDRPDFRRKNAVPERKAKSKNMLEKSRNKYKSKSKEKTKERSKSVKKKTDKKAKSEKIKIKTKKKIKIEDSEGDEELEAEVKVSLTTSNMLGPKCIRLGLCCMNNLLRVQKEPIFCSRSIVLATYKSKGKIEATNRALDNVKDIEKLLDWNKSHYIECLRLSSDLFPHYSNHSRIEPDDRYSLTFVKKELQRIGKIAKENGHRITMHPGQFNVVGTPTESAFQQTIIDLKMHADILDMMELDENSIMVVHGGGVYGDKKKTILRWIENFKRLPENVQRRLVLENDEKNFSIIDCLEVNKVNGIPVVFDNHHFHCYIQMHPDEEFEDIRVYIKQALDTWTIKGLRPKFHISEQAEGKRVGAHSDYIKTFPNYYLEIPEKYGVGVDIMIEAKAKEAAVLDLYQRYKSQLLSRFEDRLDEEEDDIFGFDKEKMAAIKCKKCTF